MRELKDGELIRGERKINAFEAGIVTRIFNEYAAGKSPRAIAVQLNKDGVPCPSGKAWGPSTIHGNRRRGTGILNNEIYVGRLIWNRLRYVKDPDTGKRVSRLNPESEWIVKDVPDLRIIDDDLWDKAKVRQGELDAHPAGSWNRRRPRYLFSGLMRCGVCGGGAVVWNRMYIGCANARNKGTCDNKATIRRDDLESLVLDGLQHRLMDPALMDVFCAEYTREVNRLRREKNAAMESEKAELAKVGRDLERLVQAIIDGVPGSQVKDKMGLLERRKVELESRLENAEEEKVALHPNMAQIYRDEIAGLREALADETRRSEAEALLRRAIDTIELVPVEIDGNMRLAANLHGHLAGILSMAAKTKAPLDESDAEVMCTKMVAGAGFEPATFRL